MYLSSTNPYAKFSLYFCGLFSRFKPPSYLFQRHLQHLPNGHRAGFFIGDGAGVGKGRTVAGLIWENWQHGRRKAL
jgi:P-loop containing NTP hydrolase pore-1